MHAPRLGSLPRAGWLVFKMANGITRIDRTEPFRLGDDCTLPRLLRQLSRPLRCRFRRYGGLLPPAAWRGKRAVDGLLEATENLLNRAWFPVWDADPVSPLQIAVLSAHGSPEGSWLRARPVVALEAALA